MAWTPPTLAEFRDRFPQFASWADGQVQGELSEAVGEVSERWLERDRTPAVLNLTAHRLSALGSGVSGGAGGTGTPSGAVLKAREVGDVRSEFQYGVGAPGTVVYSDLTTSQYGQRFLELKRRNFAGPLVV